MKFGKQFEFHKVPEWTDSYLDYYLLKNSIKLNSNREQLNSLKKTSSMSIKKSKTISNLTQIKNNYDHLKCLEEEIKDHLIRKKSIDENNTISINEEDEIKKFLFEYYNQIKHVEEFFNNKLQELNKDFEKLKKKMIDKKSSVMGTNLNDSLANYHNIFQNENKERDELGFAVSWKRAFSQLYNYTSWLHSYCVINSVAIQKIILKFKKYFENERISSELSEELKNFKFISKMNDVIDLRKLIQNFYAHQLTNGNVKTAINELETRMKGNRRKDIAFISFYCGMLFSLIFFYFLLFDINNIRQEDSIYVFFPAFDFTFTLILFFFGLAFNIKIFRKYRINYIYIFEIDPKSRLGHSEIFKTALFMLNMWFLLLILTKHSLSFNSFGNLFYVFPLIIICFYVIFLLWPFHWFYHNLRKNIILCILKNFFPIGRRGVLFRDFMFGDILTSLTKPLATLTLSFCLFTCEICRNDNVKMNCTRNNTIALYLMLIPFIIRFFQCINRYYYTRMAWPHIANAVKYIGGLLNIIISWMYSVKKVDTFVFICVVLSSTCYTLFWDIYMDWNLGRISSTNFFLRDKITYPKWMYYSAIIVNSVLRFTWLTNLIEIPIDDELKTFILSVLEVCRRTQWSLFRVENENTSNPEKYRNILDIPELPLD